MHGFYAFAWFEAGRGAGSLAPVNENEPSGAAEEAQRSPKGPTTVIKTTLNHKWRRNYSRTQFALLFAWFDLFSSNELSYVEQR